MVAGVALTVIAVVLILPVPSRVVETSEGVLKRESVSWKTRVFVFLVFLMLAAMSVYQINCMMVGQCSVTSWIHASIIVIIGICAVLLYLYTWLKE